MKKEVLIRGRKIIYFEEGRGFPFLMIHGWGPRSGEQFFQFQEILSRQGYRVILPILPGFEENGNGNSGDSTSRWGMQEYLACISDFIESLDLKEFFLLGHSLGGAIAIRLAVLYPRKIRILVLLSPGIIMSARSSSWKWWVFRGGFHIYLAFVWLAKSFLYFISEVLKKIISFPVKNALNRVNGWIANFEPYHSFLFRKDKIMCKILEHIVALEDTLPYLSEISQPTCLFWGKKDFNYYLNYYLLHRGFAKRIADCTVYMILDSGHAIQKDAPEKTAELIADFIKKQEPHS